MPKMSSLITLAILAVLHQAASSQNRPAPSRSSEALSPPPSSSSRFVFGRTIIEDVVFTGFDEDLRNFGIELDYPIYKTDFDRELRGASAQINTDDALDPDHVERVIVRLKSWLSAKAYLKADVSVLGEPIKKDRIRLIFSVRRGPLVTVKEIEFIGSKSISSEQFRQDLIKCSGSTLKIFDLRIFELYTQRCTRQLLYSHGFLKAKVLSIERQLVGDAYNISVKVFEGDRYRFGRVVIDGESVIAEKEIREWLSMASGDIADARKLQKFVYETLKEKYAEKGYVQFDAEFEPEFVEPIAEGLEGTVNIQIYIEEGKQFTVRRIAFAGIESNEEKFLKESFELREGEIFVPSKLATGIGNINKTERFHILDKDQDVEIRTDEEEGNLDLFINLRKLRP